MSTLRAIILDPADNVATLIEPGAEGDTALLPDGRSVKLTGSIPAGHKVALLPIACGAQVTKYGAPIGVAKSDIASGEWVHVHNVRSARGKGAGAR